MQETKIENKELVGRLKSNPSLDTLKEAALYAKKVEDTKEVVLVLSGEQFQDLHKSLLEISLSGTAGLTRRREFTVSEYISTSVQIHGVWFHFTTKRNEE